MPSLNFKSQFAEAVADGTKTQTVRQLGKRRWIVGDRAVCFTGMRHKGCRLLCVGTVYKIAIVRMSENGLELDEYYPGLVEANEIAVLDGFQNVDAMLDWFKAQYGLPFIGQLIRWTVNA
jgi:hypothetical protein